MSAPEEAERAAKEWLRFAREDLLSAEGMLVDRSTQQPRHVCFGAQEAAEKAIKAVCVARQVEFPFSHDLEALAGRLDPDAAVRSASPELAWLSQWAVASRYPGEGEEPGWTDAERAVREARTVVDAAAQDLRGDE